MKRRITSFVTAVIMLFSVFTFTVKINADTLSNGNKASFKYAISYDGVNYESDSITDEGYFVEKNIKIDFTKDYFYLKVEEAIGHDYQNGYVKVEPSDLSASLSNNVGAFEITNSNGVFKIPTKLLNQYHGEYDYLAMVLPGLGDFSYNTVKFVIDPSNITGAVIDTLDLKNRNYIDTDGNVISIDTEGKVTFSNQESSKNKYDLYYLVDSDGKYQIKEVSLQTMNSYNYFTYDSKLDELTYKRTSSGIPPEYLTTDKKFSRCAINVGTKGYKTIQDALAAANPKDEIKLENDVFTEELIITKDVTITGTDVKNSIIKGKINISGCNVVFNNLKVENNTNTAYGEALITYPKDSKNATATFNNCIINDNDTAFRLESDGSILNLNNTDVTGKAHYGIGIRNLNQNVNINGGTITGWAGIMTSGGTVSTKESNTVISVKNATIIGDLGNQKGSYGAIVLQENYHGVSLTIDNSSIIAKGELTSALDIRSYGSDVIVNNSNLIANDLVYGAMDGEENKPIYQGAIVISENQKYETEYKGEVTKPGTNVILNNTTIQCTQIKKNGDVYEGTYPITNSRTNDTVKIDGILLSDYVKLKMNKSTESISTGDTKTITVSYPNAYYYDDVKWESNASSIAKVDDKGNVTAVAPGTAKITATVNGKTATCTVTVYKVEPVTPPTVDTTKPVEEVTVGVNDKASQEIISNATSSIVADIMDGKLVENVDQETVAAVKAAVDKGQTITTEVKVKKISADEVNKEAKATIIQLVSEETTGDKTTTIVEYLDLSILLKAGEEELGTVNELGKEVAFTVAIPEELIKEGRVFYVVRVHEGMAEKLPVTLNEDGTITFKTDKFSTYALVYEDGETTTPITPTTPTEDKKETTSNTNKGVDTGDTTNTTALIILMGLAIVVAGRKVTSLKK